MFSDYTKIIIGTTPTIKYVFNKINVNDINVAKLTVSRYDQVLITKSLENAVVGEDFISFTLAQQETLDIGVGEAEIMLNWVDNSGVRGTGKTAQVKFLDNDIKEVL